ncbi:MAG TPA: hypothetical protein ENI87_10770, partial [bacterium]|nr:hypothetical protein [bacterium]
MFDLFPGLLRLPPRRQQAAHDRLRAWWRQRFDGTGSDSRQRTSARAEALVARWRRMQCQPQQPILWAPDPVAAGCLLHMLVTEDLLTSDPLEDPRYGAWRPAVNTGPILAYMQIWPRVHELWAMSDTLDQCINAAVHTALERSASAPYRWAQTAAHTLQQQMPGGCAHPTPARLPWSGLNVQPHSALLVDALTTLGCVDYLRTPSAFGRAGRTLLALHELVDSVWELPGCIVLVPHAKRITLRDMELHATDGPAIDYGRSLQCFALEGVIVPRSAIERPETIPAL